MNPSITRCLAVASLLLGAARPVVSQAPPAPVPKQPIAPRGAFDPARIGSLTVSPPAALSRDELARRLKALDGSLPSVLPPGAAVIMTPGQLQYGRTRIGMYGAEFVGLDGRGRAVAIYSEVLDGRPDGLYLEFDVGGPSRYAIDLHLAGNEGAPLGGTFHIAVWGPGQNSVAPVTTAPDGHLLYLFAAPGAGRYTVNIERQAQGRGRWFFYRAELLRVR